MNTLHENSEHFKHFGDVRRILSLLPNGDHMTAVGASRVGAGTMLVTPLRAFQAATHGKTIVTVHLYGRRCFQKRYFFTSEVEERGAIIADDDGRLFIAFPGSLLRRFARPTWNRQLFTHEREAALSW